MARDRSALARAYVLSLLIHGAMLALPPPVGGSEGFRRVEPLRARLLGAERPTPARVEEPSPALPLPPEPAQATATTDGPSVAEETPRGVASGTGSLPLPIPGDRPLAAAETMQPIYLAAAELHQQPIPLARIDLTELAQRHPGARARFSLLIDDRGKVAEVSVRESNSAALSASYKAYLEQLRFVPGKIAGQAVRSNLVIEITLPGISISPPPARQAAPTATMRVP
jgi:hypothetical protein